MANILIADDNMQIASIIEEYLRKEGHTPFHAKDGVQALEMFHKNNPDAVLLDVMMPGMDGFAVCREIRKISSVPVIMVTARGEDFERIMGLDIGADDYIVKPFSPGELMARLRAVLRRISPPGGNVRHVVNLGNLQVDLENYSVRVNGRAVSLTRRELELLYTLAANHGKVFSRENLLDNLWGYDYFGDSRTVDSHIKRLRAKLEVFQPQGWEIRTIWGIGYKMEKKADEA
ncbi:MAG: response regulator transcription factor [Eubacteriales bacterium]|nr:response regulator transcription factor [Eubacteriales bacterium]